MQSKISDTEAMSRCLELALNGSGSVSPNPLVGSVIIKDGAIISEAWHEEYGGLHAEINAINKSGLSSFEGMTLAVNLEPCSHFGKQAPCVDTIIEKKFSRVIIGMKDPNPLVSGNGIEKLKKAGIAVDIRKRLQMDKSFFLQEDGNQFPIYCNESSSIFRRLHSHNNRRIKMDYLRRKSQAYSYFKTRM